MGLWAALAVLALAVTLPAALALTGSEVRMGPLVATGFVEGRSAEAQGFSHWKDQTSEGWVLRLGDAHWVMSMPF